MNDIDATGLREPTINRSKIQQSCGKNIIVQYVCVCVLFGGCSVQVYNKHPKNILFEFGHSEEIVY